MDNYYKQKRTRARSVRLDEPLIRIPCVCEGIEVLNGRDSHDLEMHSPHLEWPCLPDLWDQSKGEGIKVAVLDSGAKIEHKALIDNIEGKKNFTEGPSDDVTDEVGHGTMVAGIIAACDPVGQMFGVAPKVKLYIGKVIKRDRNGMVRPLISGIEWARRNRVDVINISLGSARSLPPAVREAIIEACNARIFVVCAAGNDGIAGLDSPAKYEECIAVGAVTREKVRWNDPAGRGSSAIGNELDLMALGHQVSSTSTDRDGVSVRSGTSLAAPYVTGLLALGLAKYIKLHGDSPNNDRLKLREHLLRTAIDLPEKKPDRPGKKSDGFESLHGHGLIDPEAFLNSIQKSGR